jgi:hypothetical protein
MRLLFFRRMEETDKLGRGDAGSSSHRVSDARVSCGETGSSGVNNDLAIGADSEMAHGPLDGAGQSQLAGRIEKQQNAFARAITLDGLPQAGPFPDRQHLPRANTAHALIYMKADLDSGDAVSLGSSTLNRLNRTREDVARALSQRRRMLPEW